MIATVIETELKSFATRAFRVAVDPSGRCVVEPIARAGHPYLDGLAFTLWCADEPVVVRVESAVIDTDEVQQVWRAPGVAAIEIRHSFVAGWRTRVVITNLADEARPGRFSFGVRPGAGYRPWRLAVGSAGALALLPEEPGVPILYARTVHVAAPISEADDPTGMEIGPYRIGSGERLVLAWEWATARHFRQLAAELSAVLPAQPRWPCAAVGEEIWVPTDPDTALVIPDDVGATDLGDRQALAADEPGRRRVELRSALGSTTLDLSWVTPVPEFLAAVAERLLSGPAGPAGVVGLPDLPAALVVQRAARTAGFPAAVAAADALDQFTARLSDAGPDPALGAAYLAGEYDRLGDPELIARATELAGRPAAAVPGLGLAVLRTAVASMLAGGPPAAPPRPVPAAADAETLADAELLFATRPPDLLVEDASLTAVLYRLGVDLRAGLPGRLPGAPVAELAHACAVLRLVPDAFTGWWLARFGQPIVEVADARALEVVERLGPDGPISAAHAWLALGC